MRDIQKVIEDMKAELPKKVLSDRNRSDDGCSSLVLELERIAEEAASAPEEAQPVYWDTLSRFLKNRLGVGTSKWQVKVAHVFLGS